MIKISNLVTHPRHINCVEGNTTLYALPKAEIVSRWYEQTHDDFRFCFKFPATISHQASLRNCDDLSHEFFTRLAPLSSRIGQYWLQLPATFGPRDLPALWQFLDSLPREFSYGVEVRHPEFFAKEEAEQQLNRGLHQRNVNRVILDSRPVHSAVARSPAMLDAQRKKPKVPVHALVTAHHPMVRLSAAMTWRKIVSCLACGYARCQNGHRQPRRTCSSIPRISPRRRNWSTPCGAICAPPYRK